MTEARLVIKVDSTGATAGKKSLDDLAQAGAKAEGATDGVTKSTERFSNAARTAVGVLASLGVALSAREIIQFSDAWRNAENQLRLVTDNTGELAGMQRTLVQLANTTNSEFGATATLYSRLARSTVDLGLSQQELIGITRTINQSFAVSGATAGEAEGAIRQLAQGFAAGALRGDEFNSVAENAPGIMDAIAKSLNMTRGELRNFAADGGVTADIVVKALQGAAESIESDFNKAALTFGQSLVIVKNNMTEFVGESDAIQESVGFAGKALIAASENLDHVAAVAGIASIAIGTNYVAAATAGATATGTMTAAATGLRTALTLLAGPAGIVTLAAGAMYLLVQRQKETADAAWQQALRFDDVIERLHIMTTQEIQLAIREEERHRLVLEKKRDGLQILFDTQGMYKDELRRANMEVSNSVDNQALLERQLARVNAGWKPLTASTSQNTVVTTENAAAVITLDEVYRRAAGGIQLTADAYVRMMGITDEVTIRQTRLSADTQAVTVDMETLGLAMSETATASAQAAQISADEWRDFRNSFSDGLADLMMNGGSVFDNIAKSFERMLYKMAGDLIASGVMSFLTGGKSGGFSVADALSNSGATGTLVSAGFSKFAPGLAASLGLGGAGTGVAAAGSASSVIGAYSAGGSAAAAAAGGSAAGGGLMSGLGALTSNPITWAVAGAALIASQLKESTPSHNAGFLLNAVPGAKADQMFNVAPFASGLAPVGFTRRAGQADAMGVIDSFRIVDQQITDIARGAGLAFNITAERLSGLAETGLGSGRFFGSAGEEGKLGLALDSQIDMFARQLIGQLAGQLEGETLNRVLSAGDAGAMIRELENAIGKTVAATTETALLAAEQARTAETTAMLTEANSLLGESIEGAISSIAAAHSVLGRDFATAGVGESVRPSRIYEWLNGSHANGLDYVPFDGYRAELHTGERVQTAKQARDSDRTAAEVRDLKDVTRSLVAAMEKTARAGEETADILQQVIRGGLSMNVSIAS